MVWLKLASLSITSVFVVLILNSYRQWCEGKIMPTNELIFVRSFWTSIFLIILEIAEQIPILEARGQNQTLNFLPPLSSFVWCRLSQGWFTFINYVLVVSSLSSPASFVVLWYNRGQIWITVPFCQTPSRATRRWEPLFQVLFQTPEIKLFVLNHGVSAI